MSFRLRGIAALGLLALAVSGVACGSEGSGAATEGAPSRGDSSPAEALDVPSWGVPASRASADALGHELARTAGGSLDTVAGVWSQARIGARPARLMAVLDDPKLADAWASLGLLPDPAGDVVEDALWTRYAIEDDEARAVGLLFAIARVGGSKSVERLAVDLARPPTNDHAGRYVAALEAFGLLCSRGVALTPQARDALAEGLQATHTEAADAATWSIGRCAGPSAELLAVAEEREVLVQRLVARLGEGDSDRLTWRALRGLGEVPERTLDARAPLGRGVGDWVGEVEQVRAFAGVPGGAKRLLAALDAADLSEFDGARAHSLLTALESLRPSIASLDDAGRVLAGLRQRAQDFASGPRAARLAAHLSCEIGVLDNIVHKRPELPCTSVAELPPGHVERLRVEVLLHMGAPAQREGGTIPTLDGEVPDERFAERARLLLEAAKSADPRKATPALAALSEIPDASPNQILREALTRPDLAVVAAAATAIATRADDSSRRDLAAVPALEAVVSGLGNDDAVEARISAIRALGQLARQAKPSSGPGGKPSVDPGPVGPVGEAPWLERTLMPLADDPAVAVRHAAASALEDRPLMRERFDARAHKAAPPAAFGADLAKALESVGDAAGLRVETSAGSFDIDFRGAPAPINQANLVALAERDYFEGIRWHRVVPGFVIQGGDPRGDGYGGPGYLVPCEWSNLRYARGTVGVALAGKDTGGSQIFVTHAPQAHLDGRYTVVGHVVRGMDTVDAILPGDEFLSVSALSAAQLDEVP